MNLSEAALSFAARAHLPMGDAFRRLYAFLPFWILASLAGIFTCVLVYRRLRARAASALPQLGAPLTSGPHAAGVVVFCTALVALLDGPGLLHGFFRQDDFSFLQVARVTPDLLRQMPLFHNDHLYPLFRVEIWALLKAAGPQASPLGLAAWFNAVNGLTCVALLAAGCWLLHELGASRGAILAFPVVLWLWPGWGEFTAGFYTLGAYLQVIAAGLAATAALLRGRRLDSRNWRAVSLLLAIGAAVLDTSGLSFFPMLACVALATVKTWRELSSERWFWVAYAITFAALLAFYFRLAQHPYSARELVQNPAGVPLGLPWLVKNFFTHPQSVWLTLLTAPAGLLFALGTPSFCEYFLYAQPVDSLPLRLILASELLGSLFVVYLVWRAVRTLPQGSRPALAALAVNSTLGLALVVAARPLHAASIPIPFWHAKYLVIPLTWGCLSLLLTLDRLQSVGALSAASLVRIASITVIAGLWCTLSYRALERVVFPHPTAYVARGRWGNVQCATKRAEAFHQLVSDCEQIAVIQRTRKITLPDNRLWSRAFFRHFAILEWGGDRSPSGVTHLFFDYFAVAPQSGLSCRYQSAADFSPEMRAALARVIWLDGSFSDSAAEPGVTSSLPLRSSP